MSSEQLPVIKDGELTKKKLTGKVVLRGTCPACGAVITLTQKEVLKAKDSCPDCGTWFAIGMPELRKVQALHAEAEKAKEQAQRDRDERDSERRRVDAKNLAADLRSKKEAAAKQHQLSLQNEVNERNKVAIKISDLAETAKVAGFEETNERFPNLAKAIRWWEQIVQLSMCLGGLAILGVVIAAVNEFDKPQGMGTEGLLGAGFAAGILAIWYVICMALIELYKVFVSIEDSTRKNNALVAAQIDLMGKLVEKEN